MNRFQASELGFRCLGSLGVRMWEVGIGWRTKAFEFKGLGFRV